MLSFLAAPLAAAVDAALAGAPPGKVAVIGDAWLARRLGQRGREAVLVDGPSGRRRGEAGAGAPLPFDDGSLAAVIGAPPADPAAWDEVVAGWRRAVVDGGVIVALDRGVARRVARGEPTEPARRALCAGLTDVTQRSAGRTLVTSGRVVALDRGGARLSG